MDAPKKKRHFNMASRSSDLRIVERARDMSDMYETHAALELGIGFKRLKRLMVEYGLEFQHRYEFERPSTPIKTNQDLIDHFKVAKIDGIKCKKCTKCKIVKPVEMFHLDKTKKLGRVSACKSCVSCRKVSLLDGFAA